jgi:hypothetical protein
MVGSDAAFKLRNEVKRQKVGIQFKLFDPSPFVRQRLQRLGSTPKFEIVSTDDISSLLYWEGPRNGTIQSLSKALRLNAA